ncbi:hypothetical protein [uncultured Sphingomonas sp.]|uniref:hypothetical protein n=1 Tax=uncultured Sphingomonas sp. TaxID=158754 RepID=UPI0025CE15EA|nr:hypothetical protein [uncultured Sphingomonas sp.]
MIAQLSAALIALAAPAEDDFDPTTISEVDALQCRLDVPSYNGFAFAITGEEQIARKRGWRKVDSGNPMLDEYELPSPIRIGSWSTRRIAFSSSGIVAILDVADPAVVAKGEGIANALDADAMYRDLGIAMPAGGFRKFLGQKVVVDKTVPATADDPFGSHVTIARSISNVTTLPGKTLYGCSYRMELLDKNGKPL